MNVRTSSATAHSDGARRGMVNVDGKAIHYRVQGNGPAVVMLHDSPRSSRMHLPAMEKLAADFMVFALDTPGYGNSDPLGLADPEISDFAHALHKALEALGLTDVPLYATHTSAKIAVDYAARHPLAPVLILDGVSIPEKPTTQQFIDAYMRPFIKDADGGFLAREWTRIRDMVRWFPWFSPSVQTRMSMTVTPEWLQDYSLDVFSAGPHYSKAYAAAMRYTALPALKTIRVPTMICARKDDVLYSHLQRVPLEDNEQLSTHPLPADRDIWFTWLKSQFQLFCNGRALHKHSPQSAADRKVYVDDPDGQILVHRRGPVSSRPLLILDAPTTMHARHWADVLSPETSILVPELPGFGESDALPQPTAARYTQCLAAIIDQLTDGKADLLATGHSAPLALKLAAEHPDKVARLILDGACAPEAFPETSALPDLAPAFRFSLTGAHLHQVWHMLRDQQANWPWYDASIGAQRQLQPLLKEEQLYDAFIGILKQPVRYADALKASLEAVNGLSLKAVSQPCLVFDHPTDGAYRGATGVAERLSQAKRAERPADTADAVPVVTGFLNDTPYTANSPAEAN